MLQCFEAASKRNTMPSSARRLFRRVVPQRIRSALVQALGMDRDVGAVFSKIYEENSWGTGGGRFYSGDGSHDPELVRPYVEAVRGYIGELERPVHLFDIGCGDFNVGRQLVDYVDSYLGGDIVPELIEHNRAHFERENVHFRVIDAISEELPPANLVCVRQVFQHLSNAQIQAVVPKLARYRHWIITEHLPSTDFTPNADKRHGRSIRLDNDVPSGIVLTAPPFNVRPTQERVLCEVASYGGIVRTTAYAFAEPLA